LSSLTLEYRKTATSVSLKISCSMQARFWFATLHPQRTLSRPEL